MIRNSAPAGQGLRVRRFGRVNWIGLWTLFLRDLLRDLDIWKITVAAPALQSLLFAFIFQLALGDVSLTMGGLDFNAFLVPGLVAYVVLERGFESTAYMMVYDKLEGMITDVIGAPVTPAEMTIGFAVNGGAMLGLVGLAGGLWADKWDHITGVQTFVVVPALYMSGVFFSLDRLPEAIRAVAELNPAWYVIDGVRYGLPGTATADPSIGAIVVLAVNIVLWLICWRLFASGYKLKP